MSTTIIRAARTPLAWLLFVAMAVLLLLALESTGGNGGPVTLNSHPVGSSVSQPASTGGGHCTDGKGKDDTKNKHCQISNR